MLNRRHHVSPHPGDGVSDLLIGEGQDRVALGLLSPTESARHHQAKGIADPTTKAVALLFVALPYRRLKVAEQTTVHFNLGE